MLRRTDAGDKSVKSVLKKSEREFTVERLLKK